MIFGFWKLFFLIIFMSSVGFTNGSTFSRTVRLHENFIYLHETWIETIDLDSTSKLDNDIYKETCMKTYDSRDELCKFDGGGWKTKVHSLDFDIQTIHENTLYLKCKREDVCTTTY
jgi:hypothetical protein